MKITRLETFILHVPVTGARIADSVHQVTHWGAPGVIVHADGAHRGYGYTGTHGHLATDRLIAACMCQAFGPLLAGQDPLEVRHLHERLAHCPPIRWVGRAGVTQMALSAIDVALWDLKAKAAGQPLWKLLGGSASKRVPAYHTDGGWLSLDVDALVQNARRHVEEEGFRGVKIKVGSRDPHDDLERIEAVRRAIGPRVDLMVDGNGAWDLPTAVRFGRRLADYDVRWFEEPIYFDDVRGHAELARAISTPIALGEQLYTIDAFRDFLAAGAVHYVQPDATRAGGITGCWAAAELAAAWRRPVCFHAGDMMQIHQHLAIAHPAAGVLEYIPWLRECFAEPAAVEGGCYRAPEQPGAGTTLRDDAVARFGVE